MSSHTLPSNRKRDYETYCLDPKWQIRWVWISVLVLGPCAFFAGLGTGRRRANRGTISTSSSSNTVGTMTQTKPEGSQQQPLVFLQTHQNLTSSDPSICRQNEDSSYCLQLQPNGSLFLYQGKDDKIAVLWNSQVDMVTGDYWTQLYGDGNLITSRDSGAVVWASQSISMEGNYQLILDPQGKGLQIVRDEDEPVVVWSTTSTMQGQGNNSNVNNTETNGDDTDDLAGEATPVEAPVSIETSIPTTLPTVASPVETIIPTLPPSSETIVIPEQVTAPPWTSAVWSNLYSLRSGPLVGHVTDQTVSLWALQGEGLAMELFYRPAGASTGFTLSMPPNADQGAAIVEVSMLQPDMEYEYQVRIQGETVGEGVWKTASPIFQPTQFQFLLASCMDVKSNRHPQQPVWDQALQQGNPDFAMLNGDTVYLTDGDWTSGNEIILERVWARNLDQRDESHFKNFISKVPTYSVWDDHEYGSNNSDKDQPGKYNSLKAFTNLWANPGAGTSSVEGVFYSFYRGDVHFIVCDNRWYRDPSTGSQWGTAQIDWISNQLRESVGVFKIIVSGGDVMEQGFSKDMAAIGIVVTQYSISGVLFCAGDIHRNEFKAMDHTSWPYKVTQITSSGIARDWRRPWAMVHVDTISSNPGIRVHFYGAESEALSTSWGNDSNLPCGNVQAGDRYSESRCTQIILLSDLSA